MIRKFISTLFLFGLMLATSYKMASADGIIIPEPPICDPCPVLPAMSQLTIRYHHVTVNIEEQVAITRVDQIFYNPNDWEVEGDYVFPVPRGATINNFALWIDGEPIEGEILDAETARKTYEQIVATMRDPALLEYADQDAFRARIYPILPKGERRIEIQYSQVLTSDNGLVEYLYPLNTEKFSREPLDSVSVTVEIKSGLPIRAVYSPSHDIAVTRESKFLVSASYEENDVLPDNDFSLVFSIGKSEAFHLLTYKDGSDIDDPYGFFFLLLAPAIENNAEPISKDVILVVDQSGSMEGEKFKQSQQAMRYILEHLNPEDRFNIIAFSTGIDVFRRDLSTVSETDEAIRWVNQLKAAGSTDINRALLDAASQIESDRPAYLIFLTDGLPTVGEVESDKIIDNFQKFAPSNLSLFVFGVGYDVDTYLLDSLAQNHHGKSTYVIPGEELDEILSSFYNEISEPVMTSLQLDFGNLITRDIYPDPLPDLFQGSQIAIFGRYLGSGNEDVTLTGFVNGEKTELVFRDQQFEDDRGDNNDTFSSIASLWATRKIGYLLQQIRLNGPDDEIIEEIVQLSIRYGIVTPYTSYLVTEPSMLGVEERERIITEEVQRFNDLATMPTFGKGAVEQAEGQNSLANADSAPELPKESLGKIRKVDFQTFILNDGVWTDTRYDPQISETTKITFLSEKYFSLAKSEPHLAKVFALGPRVIVLHGNTTYEVVTDKLPSNDTPIATQANEGTNPEIENRDGEPNPISVPSSSSLLPCWGGLIITMLPMLIIGYVRIRDN